MLPKQHLLRRNSKRFVLGEEDMPTISNISNNGESSAVAILDANLLKPPTTLT